MSNFLSLEESSTFFCLAKSYSFLKMSIACPLLQGAFLALPPASLCLGWVRSLSPFERTMPSQPHPWPCAHPSTV